MEKTENVANDKNWKSLIKPLKMDVKTHVNKSIATMVIKSKTETLKYGVAFNKESRLKSLSEKPSYNYNIITGIYILNYEVRNPLPWEQLYKQDLLKFHLSHQQIYYKIM